MARKSKRPTNERRVPGPKPRGDAIFERRQRSFRIGFGALALVLLSVNLAVGIGAWVEEHRISDYSVATYDNAFVAATRLNRSALFFERYVSMRAAARSPAERAAADEMLRTAAADLQMAIERKPKGPGAALQEAVLADFAALRSPGAEDSAIDSRLADAEDKYAELERLALTAGATAREDIKQYSAEADWPLLTLGAARVLAAAASLYLIYRFVRRMAELANYDPLTGLPKRPLLFARLTDALRRMKRGGAGFALLSLDLDRFKVVNDTLGHQTGDKLLQEVARRVGGRVRTGDIVARFGGDEFVVLQASLRSPEDAGLLAERLVAVLGAPYDIDGHRIHIGASVGVALAPQDGSDAEDLLRNSDIALYRAKTEGKGRYLYFSAPAVSEEPAERAGDRGASEASVESRLEMQL